MATSANAWMPTQGRHPVNIGSSLGRALKARKLKGSAPATNTKRSALPDRDFYSFRYNFKPSMIDAAKPGTIDVTKGKESTTVMVELPSSQAGEAHVFKGVENPAKEVDCVLIYDEETGTYTLEKLDSYTVLSYERKTISSAPPATSPSPPPPPASSSKKSSRDLDFAAQLDRDLLGLLDANADPDADADGDVDDDLEEILPSSLARSRKAEEEEEEEIFIPPPSPPKPQAKPSRPVKPLPKTRASPAPAAVLAPSPRPVKPLPKPRVSPVPIQAPPPPPPVHVAPPAPPKSKVPMPGKGKKVKKAPEPVHSEPDEENLEFGVPATRSRASPHPASSGLALPGPSSSFTAPLKPAPTPVPVRSPSPPLALSESEEEDWEPALPVADDASGVEDDIFGGEEIELDLERELNRMEDSDEDFLVGAVTSVPETPKITGPPISLKQLAGGGEVVSEDDYSSSEDSDDD